MSKEKREKRNREIFETFRLGNKTLKEVGKIFKLSTASISKIIGNFLKKHA